MYYKRQLLDMQKRAELVLQHSPALATTFADRFDMAKNLFAKLDKQMFIDCNDIDPTDPYKIETWKDENVPKKSFALKHQGPVFGFDVDTMVGPVSWHDETSGMDDYVLRRKCYIYDWTADKLKEDFPELTYFTDLHKEFVPVLLGSRGPKGPLIGADAWAGGCTTGANAWADGSLILRMASA